MWRGKSIDDFKAIPLTKDLLEITTPKGGSLLESALHAFKCSEVLEHVNSQGLQLRADILLDERGKATPLFETLIGKKQLSALFTPDNWRGASREELFRVHHALPEAQQAKVGIMGLAQQISTSQKQGLGR